MTPSQIAFKAADYMAEHGHCKYTLVDEAGRVCLEGAVRMAAYGRAFGRFDRSRRNGCLPSRPCRHAFAPWRRGAPTPR